jgi:methyl-accepting chemotaxis protein
MATEFENQEPSRRRRYFIDRAFQGKYVALLAVFIVSLGIAGLLILVFGSGSVSGQEAPNLRGAILAMLGVLVVFMTLTVWYGVRFSHRIVGPIYAIGRHLGWVLDGNYTRDLKLREKDEFQQIAAAFNEMQASLRQRARNDVAALVRVDAALAELAQTLAAPEFNREQTLDLIKRLRQDLEAARAQTEGYVTP